MVNVKAKVSGGNVGARKASAFSSGEDGLEKLVADAFADVARRGRGAAPIEIVVEYSGGNVAEKSILRTGEHSPALFWLPQNMAQHERELLVNVRGEVARRLA